ncbi:hypothetical protein MTO96_035809 [Rhipicephalus appendiculatus]
MEGTEGTSNPNGGRDTDSGHEDTITARDLLQILQEKDRLLSTLLERLAVAGGTPPQPAQTFQVIPDFSHNISPFDGSEDAPSARECIDNIRRTSNLHGWPAAYTLETAKARLVGAAKDWYRSRSSQITSWEEFEVRFRRTFVSQTSVAERWRRMQERVQQRNESTTAYFHSKVRLCHEVNLDFNDTRGQVLTGLRSRELCTMLLGRTNDDDDDLLHDILEFERIERERRELFGSRNRSIMSPPFSERSLPATMTKARDRRLEPRNGSTPAIAVHQPTRNESNVVTEALPCTGAGHVLIKEVIFNDDFALVGLIDTGSSGCLLRASAAARCGIQMVLEPTDLYGFGSENHPVTRSLGHCKAKVSIDGVVAENIPVLIVPDDAQRVDILVGRTFTELPNVTYAKVGSTFRFYHLNDCPFVHLVSPAQQAELQVKTPEECTLQKNAVNYVTTSSDRSVTVFRGHCGRDGLPEWKRGEITATVDDPKQLGWDVKSKPDECNKNKMGAPSKSTNKNSSMMLHAYKSRFSGLQLQPVTDTEIRSQSPQELRPRVRQRLRDGPKCIKEACDRRNYTTGLYEAGEIIRTSKASERTGNPTTTRRKYRGPRFTTQALPADTYRASDLCYKMGGGFATTTRISNLTKSYFTVRTSRQDDNATEEFQDEEENPVRQLPQHGRILPTRLRDYVVTWLSCACG